MKLYIRESNDDIIYIDIIKGCANEDLTEDQIEPDEIILPSNRYSDYMDTREFLSYYLQPLADRINRLRYIQNAYVHCSDDTGVKGMSNYVRIEFKHPIGLPESEIYGFYYYSIRFSDHGHESAKDKRNVIDRYEIVGTKAKDLESIGWDIFESNVETIKKQIIQHEIEKYGHQKTYL